MTIVAVITQVAGRYCLESLNPAFAHVWVMVVEAIAVTIAMYCLIQFYHQIHKDIAQHRPLQKIIAIKLVIFLSFWQTIIISFLTSAGAIKASNQFQTPDIKIGIPAMLLCIEMALFSIFHLFAFSWRPYVIGSKAFQKSTLGDPKSLPATYTGGFLGARALLDAFNPWDLIKAIGRAGKWLFRDRKHRHTDSSYASTQMDSNLALKPTDSGVSAAGAIHAPTAYNPHLRPEVLHDEGQTLLSDQAPMPKYPAHVGPHSYQPSPSPYHHEQAEYFQAGDIGVAQSTGDASTYYMPPQTNTFHTPPPYAAYHKETEARTHTPSSSEEDRYEPPRRIDPRQPRAG